MSSRKLWKRVATQRRAPGLAARLARTNYVSAVLHSTALTYSRRQQDCPTQGQTTKNAHVEPLSHMAQQQLGHNTGQTRAPSSVNMAMVR